MSTILAKRNDFYLGELILHSIKKWKSSEIMYYACLWLYTAYNILRKSKSLLSDTILVFEGANRPLFLKSATIFIVANWLFTWFRNESQLKLCTKRAYDCILLIISYDNQRVSYRILFWYLKKPIVHHSCKVQRFLSWRIDFTLDLEMKVSWNYVLCVFMIVYCL